MTTPLYEPTLLPLNSSWDRSHPLPCSQPTLCTHRLCGPALDQPDAGTHSRQSSTDTATHLFHSTWHHSQPSLFSSSALQATHTLLRAGVVTPNLQGLLRFGCGCSSSAVGCLLAIWPFSWIHSLSRAPSSEI